MPLSTSSSGHRHLSPKASQASKGAMICPENLLMDSGDSYSPNPSWHHQPLTRQSPSSREDSQRPEAGQGPGSGGLEEQRQSWGLSQEVRGRESHGGIKLCLLPSSPTALPHSCWMEKWPWWPGQERCQRDQWQRWEKGLVDCKLSITAQIISILRRALCTMPRKSNTLKG